MLNRTPLNNLLQKQWDLSYNTPQPPEQMEVAEIMHQIQAIDEGEWGRGIVPDGAQRYRRFLVEELIERWANNAISGRRDRELDRAIRILIQN